MVLTSKLSWLLAIVLGFGIAPAFLGCSKDPAAPKTPGLEQLSEADRAAATAQETCPVTHELLGEKGVPVKVVVKGQDVFVSSAEAEAALRKEPGRYLKALEMQRSE